MKKIRLNVADFGATEILSREKLKSVFGGSGSGSDTTLHCWSCWCSNSTKDSSAGGSWKIYDAPSSYATTTISDNCKSPLTGQCDITNC